MKIICTHLHTETLLLLSCSVTLLFTACQPKLESPRGFRLPDGDVDKGKVAFVQLECYRCHQISGVELPSPPEKAQVDITLGGQIYRVKTYGELVTSIINPTHVVSPKYRDSFTDEDGKSNMPDHNDKMTVKQMIDLVSFLQSRYKLTHPEYNYNM